MKAGNLLTTASSLVKYNMKIIFAGKFLWFFLAAFAFFILFMFTNVLNNTPLNDGTVYNMLLFPGILLIFYPTVFGIQNDEDTRILEIIFGIPDYRYKVWGLRLLMIFVAVFLIIVGLSYMARYLLYPVNPWEIAAQVMAPLLFLGCMAFMFSTITRSGNGTAVVMIILGILIYFLSMIFSSTNPFWNVFLNPMVMPDSFHPLTWYSLVLKNRLFLYVSAVIWLMIGLLKLQGRENFL